MVKHFFIVSFYKIFRCFIFQMIFFLPSFLIIDVLLFFNSYQIDAFRKGISFIVRKVKKVSCFLGCSVIITTSHFSFNLILHFPHFLYFAAFVRYMFFRGSSEVSQHNESRLVR